MQSTRQKLLREIKAFLRESGMTAGQFGQHVSGNSHLVTRLEKGGDVTTQVADKIEAYIASERAKMERAARPLGRTALA